MLIYHDIYYCNSTVSLFSFIFLCSSRRSPLPSCFHLDQHYHPSFASDSCMKRGQGKLLQQQLSLILRFYIKFPFLYGCQANCCSTKLALLALPDSVVVVAAGAPSGIR